MISTSGNKLLQDDAIDIIVRELFNRTSLVTPNIDEAEFLSGMKITSEKEMCQAAEKLLSLGCRAVLKKGGHFKGKEMNSATVLICLGTYTRCKIIKDCKGKLSY